MLLTSTIDAAEERYVAVIDIPNAFIQTRIENDEDKVVLRLRGKLADLLIKHHQKYIASTSQSTERVRQFCT